MSLATFSDANVHLDGKKIEFLNEEDAAADAIAADRLVKGYLFDAFGADVNQWDATGVPANTPGIVREAAAFLMAHFKYARTYSEETQSANSYARWLRREAQDILNGLADGSLELADTPSLQDVRQPGFFPDAEYVDLDTGEPIRFARMDMEF